MNITLSKKSTGLNNQIVYNTKTKQIHKTNKATYWNDKNYSILFNHLNLKVPDSLSLKFKKMADALKISTGSMHLGKILGKKNIKIHLAAMMQDLDKLSSSDNSYYNDVLPKRLALFDRLKNFYFDGVLYDRLTYTHHKTVTGRTIVSSGMNLVTMKKTSRKKLESRYDNGEIIEIDLKSIEPRLYLALIKHVDVKDAYEHLACKILGYDKENYDRAKIKIAFISSLYGASDRKLMSLSGMSLNQIKKIKNYLEVNNFKKEIEKEFKQNGYFKNAYGRKIFSINAPVNYYLQSTAVDYACLAFNELLMSIDSKNVNLIGVIVDAILLDVHPSLVERILSVKMINEPIISITAHTSIIRYH